MRKISILMATVFLDMLGFAMVFPLLPYYALRLDAEPWLIGWMIATYSLTQIVAAPIWAGSPTASGGARRSSPASWHRRRRSSCSASRHRW